MDLRESFESGLNCHGYSFQYRIAREIETLGTKRKTRWKLLNLEVPVVVNNQATKIDLLLIDTAERGKCFIALAECKRVNPAFGTWCFVKAPYAFPEWAGTQVIAEWAVNLRDTDKDVVSGGFGTVRSGRIYSVGFTLKTDKQGDRSPVGDDKDAIENACFQVCKGMNGFVEALATDQRLRNNIGEANSIVFLPIIFTTADLYTSDTDLRDADLETGNVKIESAEPVDWLIYQYPISSNIKHSVERGTLSDDGFNEVLARDFVRSIAIVNSSGIQKFLGEHLLDETAWPNQIVLGGP